MVYLKNINAKYLFFFVLFFLFVFLPVQKTEAFCGDGNVEIGMGEQCDEGILKNIVKISASLIHTCAINTSGEVFCWGQNDNGQLGDGTTTQRSTPIKVNITGITEISTGGDFTCARTSGSLVYCWGNNNQGQLGDGTTINRTTPVQVIGLTGTTEISSGSNHTCTRTSGSLAYCWGGNDQGQLGDGTMINRNIPAQVPGLTGVAGISSGNNYTCARTSGGLAYCWGNNMFFQLGDGTATDRNTPVQVLGLTGVAGISTSSNTHTCAYTSGGLAYCWGNNQFGKLGDGTTTNRNTPVQVLGLTGVAGISSGGNHTCTYTSGNLAYCWGYNNPGQLGDGTTTNRNTPVQVLGLTGVAGIASGGFHTCAFNAGNSIYCWGQNNVNQLGDGTTLNSTSPIMPKGTNGLVCSATTYNSSCTYCSNSCLNVTVQGPRCGDVTVQTIYGEICDGTNYNGQLCTTVPGGFTGGALACNATCNAFITTGCFKCGNNTVWNYGGTPTVVTITTPGAGSWTVPAGITSIKVEAWGGGGGGGSGGWPYGGGGGAYAKVNTITVTPGSSIPYTVGIAGVDGWNNGGNTTFNTNIVIATGGNAANGNGLGGTITGSIGDVRYAGGNGIAGGGYGGGGGGGSGGSASNGNNAASNIGAAAVTNGGPGGNGGIGIGSSPISGPGGGGGAGSSGFFGSSGYAGQLKIYYVLPTRETGEVCDGLDIDGQTCVSQGFDGGPPLICNASCTFNTSACYRCGNGNIESGESCDGANLGGKSCLTQGFNGGTLSCNASCALNTSQCFTCGDGIINTPLETCDQGGGNVANGDGCNSSCQIENGYGCTGTPSVCSPNCGNGNLDVPETCDPNHILSKTTACTDANLYNGSKNCLINCSGYGTCNTIESCNDTIINGNELCDNNATPCTLNGYRGTQNCTMTGPSSCRSFNACVPTESCGDSIVNGFETCDDGNSIGGDGCNNTCQTESGYTCNNSVSPSVCSYDCGNGSLEPSEICDPNNAGTATEICATVANYPGTRSCLPNCTGYGICTTTLRCGDNTFTNPPETCDGDTRSCLTIVGLYNGTQTCTATCNSYGACVSTEYCGDHIMNGTEECDWDPDSNNQNIGSPRNGDGCSTDCKTEEGFVCSGTNPTTCVFSCGNEVLQSNTPFNEECDDGASGKINSNTQQPTTAPYNGDVCAVTNYGATCTWCDRACKNQTSYGDYCGDGVWNEGFEECDDGNFNSYDGCTSCEDGGDISDGNAGCTQGCKVETGFICSGIFSSCKTECGDGYCAVGPESCLTCVNDCGLCPIGKRPRVSAAHDKGVFASLFEKIKIFLIQPQPLIQIPGMNLGEEKLNQEFIPPPPPISKNYEVGKPTQVKIGNEYFTITVQTINSGNNSVSFTVK